MSRDFKPNSQNLRLVVVAGLAVVAIGTTFAASSENPDEVAAAADSLSTDTTIAASAPSTAVTPPPEALALADPDAGDDLPDGGTEVVEFGATIVEVEVEEAMDGVAGLVVAEDPVESEPIDQEVVSCAPIEAVVDDAYFADTFDDSADAWDALSGSWSVVDGSYQQADPAGYDLISQLRVDPPEQFSVSVLVQPLGEGLGGGLVLAQPQPAERAGATVVDFTDGGSFLRWGRYDAATGQYGYVGGVSLGESFDPSVPHELAVEIRAERTIVFVDGVEVGAFEALGFGRVGLVTSRSTVAFDDLRIVEVGT